MKNKELREKAQEIQAKLDALTLQCRQDGRSPTEEEQHQFVELRDTAKRYITEAEGLELLDGYESDKLTRYKRDGVKFNTTVNTREKASLDLAVRSFLGKSAGISCAEWDSHAEQLGLNGTVHNRAWTSTGSGGVAEFVPTTLGDTVYQKMLGYGGLLSYLNSNGGVFGTDDGEPFVQPIFDATQLTGAQIAENTADNAVDLTTSSKTFGSYPYTSGIQIVSYQAIKNSKFPLTEWVSKGLGEALGRAISAKLISGTGTGQPEGVKTNVVTGATTASTSTFTLDELRQLMFSVQEPHASNGVWLVSRTALAILFGLSDTLGRPIWLDSIRGGEPPTLFGRPVYTDLNMPAVGAASKSIIYGDIAKGYKVRLVGDLMVRVSEHRYFEFNSTGIVAGQHLDAKAVDTDCYRALVMHA